MLPKALETLIEALGELPGVGARTAERYAYSLLKRDRHVSERLAGALAELHNGVKQCPVTYALIDAAENVSPLYSDTARDKQLVAVVEEPLDIIALEKTKQFRGTYHVLGGAISPIDGVGPEQLHIPELIERLKKDHVQEVILATNASVEGESTALYIQRHIQESDIEDIVVSRLARGIPVGVDLEYADQITLTHALQGRKQLS
ncbi:MAG TPA: recombination mediator RecR [Candidatus Saccharibacteria bacterium]|nr:recombination mediator RecR [Candidatus Saccharibacteria bacterium]